MIPQHPLLLFLKAPRRAAESLELTDWSLLIRAARRGFLLNRVACIAKQAGLLESLPGKVKFHLESALRTAQSQQRNVRWEVTQITKALSPLAIPFVLLKGSAYIMAEYDAGQGRMLSDIDIMVPRARIIEAERAFVENGWFPGKLNAYDQRYYRVWMHELPPLRHLDRGTTLDVHHTILPPTAALKPDVDQLWRLAVPLENAPACFTLCPVDMILHSATHLFHDGEMEHGLRDLVDIDNLLKQFATSDDFWQTLDSRGVELNLSRPLFYALHCVRAFLGTDIPASAMARIDRHGKPPERVARLTLALFASAIGSILETRRKPMTSLASFLVFMRAHYLRMPVYLLIPHLLRKMLVPEKNRK